MFLLNDKPLPLDTPFTTDDGTQYPANWLRLSTADEKAALGITEAPDAPAYDDRYYWGPGNPKDLAECKANAIRQVKTTAGSMISASDWKIVRFAETGQAVDAATTAYRAAIRTASNTLEAEIDACTTVDELADLQFTWPEM